MMHSTASELLRAQQALAQGRGTEALAIVESALTVIPGDRGALRLRALCLSAIDDARAGDAWQQVLDQAPDDPEALYQLGTLAGDRGDFSTAVGLLRRALARLPSHPQILNNLGLALEATGSLDDAQRCFEQLLSSQPAAAANIQPNLARVLFAQGKYAQALPHLDAVVMRWLPGDAMSWAGHAVALADVGRDAEADRSYRRAIELAPRHAAIRYDYARFLIARRRYEDAASMLWQALDDLPDDPAIATLLASCRMHVADWRDIESLCSRLEQSIARADPAKLPPIPAYDFLALCDDPDLQRRVATSWSAPEAAKASAYARTVPVAGSARRITLGFVSSDLGEHPVGRLVVGLLERIDRSRFEVVAYATSQGAIENPQRARIAASVDALRTLPRIDPVVAADAIRNDGIDALFDLNGFSGGEALRIFAQRCAPVQVNYLGYPGTLGCAAYDFIVTDRYCNGGHADAYTETALYVEPCYVPSDPQRDTAQVQVSRSDYGLDENAVVLCSFAATYKIAPAVFDAWCAVLRAVPTAVLWLRDGLPLVVERLRAEAAARGVDANRVAFAPAEPLPRYLARFALADVFLDTWPYGAHTTVNDALFAGVAAVTLAGRSMAARASGSQLHAVGLSDLVTHAVDEYVARVSAIAGDRARRDDLARQLCDAGRRSALFDMERYARAFEQAVTDAHASVVRRS